MILTLIGNIFPDNIVPEYLYDHFPGIEFISSLSEYFDHTDESIMDKPGNV